MSRLLKLALYLTLTLSMLLTPLSGVGARTLITPTAAGVAVPSPLLYLPGKGNLQYQDAAGGGTAKVVGGYSYSSGYALGQTSLKAVSKSFPNAVATTAIESDLPRLAANNINMVFAKFILQRGETESRYKARMIRYIKKAQAYRIRVVLVAEWYFNIMMPRPPIKLESRRNTSSSLRSGQYRFIYTWSARLPNGRVGESNSWPSARNSISIGSGYSIVAKRPPGWTKRNGQLLDTVAGWNVYELAPNGYYVKQNATPLRGASVTLSRIKTDGCAPSQGVLRACIPPYNNTISMNVAGIKRLTSWVNAYPNVYGYWILDEPSSVGASVSKVREMYKTWRRYTRKPLIVNFAEVLDKFGNDFPTGDAIQNNPYGPGMCDICIMEMYPRQQLGPFVFTKQTAGMQKFLRIVRQKHGGSRLPTIWAMPQGHITDIPAGAQYTKRLSYAETYREANDVVRWGASGMVWYVWDKKLRLPSGAIVGGGIKDNGPALKAIKDFGARIKAGSLVLNSYSRSAYLDGGSRIQVPAKGHIDANQGTVAFWVTPVGWNGTDSRSHTLFEWAGSSSQARLAIEKRSNNTLAWVLRSSSGRQTEGSKAAITKLRPQREPSLYKTTDYPDTLYHFAITWGGGYVKLYLNGRPVGSTRASYGLGQGAQYMYLGANWQGQRSATGKYSDLTVFSTPLGAGQIEAIRAMAPLGSEVSFGSKIGKPAANQTVSGTTSVTPRANPDPAIRAVKLYVDNRLVTTSYGFPYRLSWNTRSVGNGYHNIRINYVRFNGATVVGETRRVRVGN